MRRFYRLIAAGVVAVLVGCNPIKSEHGMMSLDDKSIQTMETTTRPTTDMVTASSVKGIVPDPCGKEGDDGWIVINGLAMQSGIINFPDSTTWPQLANGERKMCVEVDTHGRFKQYVNTTVGLSRLDVDHSDNTRVQVGVCYYRREGNNEIVGIYADTWAGTHVYSCQVRFLLYGAAK